MDFSAIVGILESQENFRGREKFDKSCKPGNQECILSGNVRIGIANVGKAKGTEISLDLGEGDLFFGAGCC